MNQGGQSGNSSGGKSGPMNQITNGLGNTIQNQMTNAGQQSTTDFGRTALPAIGQAGGNFARGLIPDNNYQGGPPQLDLSGMMPQTPAQKVAQSQAGGGILKLRQPRQPFNPNPTPMPMPIDPGFGGGKGMFPPGGNIGFGGGKGGPQIGLPVERQPDNNPQMRLPVEGRY
jgi:hypothetical protein